MKHRSHKSYVQAGRRSWETRRRREAEEQARREHERRVQSGRRSWETRRRHEAEERARREHERRSEASKRGWETRRKGKAKGPEFPYTEVVCFAESLSRLPSNGELDEKTQLDISCGNVFDFNYTGLAQAFQPATLRTAGNEWALGLIPPDLNGYWRMAFIFKVIAYRPAKAPPDIAWSRIVIRLIPEAEEVVEESIRRGIVIRSDFQAPPDSGNELE